MATRLGGLQTEQCAGTRISLNAIRECCGMGSLRSAHFLHDESVIEQSVHNVDRQRYMQKTG